MLQASPNFHKGINFIQISSLPYDQQALFFSWLPESSLIKMEINDIFMEDCAEYEDYNYWFNFQYQQKESMLELGI